MAAVIRDARLPAEPVLLATGRSRPAVAERAAARDALVAPGARASAAARSPAAPSPVSEPVVRPMVQAEEAWRRQLELERTAALQQAREQGLAEGLQQGLQEGREQGIEQGREEGTRAGRAEWADRIEALDCLLASLPEQLEQGIAGSEDLMIELAFEAIVKVLGAACVTREGVAGMVKQSMRALRDRERVVLRLASADVERLEGLRAELTRAAATRTLDIVADDRVELGGCLLETAGGGLDGRLETQLQRLRDLLLVARGRAEGATP